MTSPLEACPLKVRFTRSTARRRARWLRRQGRGYRHMIAYRCEYCRGWHIGHPIGMHAGNTEVAR